MRQNDHKSIDIVFDKSVFTNIFYKDIRRVYIYKKAERLANALYLIAPAFRDSMSLKRRIEVLALSLPEAASLASGTFRESLTRELLGVSSVLSMARSGGLLSAMNADLIAREVQILLEDIASYEEPRLPLSESPSLAALARQAPPASSIENIVSPVVRSHVRPVARKAEQSKGQHSPRQESILSLITEKRTVSIKDISLTIRGVSEKTIQRELQALIEAGRIIRRGERRWSTYSISSSS